LKLIGGIFDDRCASCAKLLGEPSRFFIRHVCDEGDSFEARSQHRNAVAAAAGLGRRWPLGLRARSPSPPSSAGDTEPFQESAPPIASLSGAPSSSPFPSLGAGPPWDIERVGRGCRCKFFSRLDWVFFSVSNFPGQCLKRDEFSGFGTIREFSSEKTCFYINAQNPACKANQWGT